MCYPIRCSGGGFRRLPLGKTRFRATDISQGCEMTPEWELKNEASAHAYSIGTLFSSILFSVMTPRRDLRRNRSKNKTLMGDKTDG
jgi:hypothetical protein